MWPSTNAREPGSVFHYPYLWADDARAGLQNPKDRTTTLAVTFKRTTVEGATVIHLFLLAITDNPREGQTALEIPQIEKRRAGLDPHRPAFVVMNEYNYDILPHSHCYDRRSKTLGTLGKPFALQVKDKFVRALKDGAAKRVERAC